MSRTRVRDIICAYAAVWLTLFSIPLKGEGTYELRNRNASNIVPLLESPGKGQTAQFNLNLPRRTVLYVDILFANEVIDLYTSRTDANNNVEFAIWGPGKDFETDTPDWEFNVTSTTSDGYVGSWTEIVNLQTIAGRPRPPASFTPTTTGTYTIIVYGNGNGLGSGAVEFFDVMVRGTNGTTTTADDDLRRGRLFSLQWALSTQNFNDGLFTDVFVIDGEDQGTSYEGYVWEGDMNGIQPFGFHMYANRVGSNPEAYNSYSVDGAGETNLDPATPQAIMSPEFQIYLNDPEKPSFPPNIPQVDNLRFDVNCQEGTPSEGIPSGGIFEFETNGEWVYEIVLDENGDDVFNRNTERALTGDATAGTNMINWDGLFEDGSPAPNETQVRIVLRARASEIHFPFFDVENQNSNTGPTFALQGGDNDISQFYYWDDTEVGGTSTVGVGSLTPHTWGTGGVDGNERIIDTWKAAFEDIQEYALAYSCSATNLRVRKAVTDAAPLLGDTLDFTVDVINLGPNKATFVELTDVFPVADLTVLTNTVTSGTFNLGTGVWDLDSMQVDDRDTLFISATVNGGTVGLNIKNKAEVTLLQADPDLDNNRDSVIVSPREPRIQGIVFEDLNYGGGDGRTLTESSGEPISGVRVELYDASGAFISATTTDASGEYLFSNLSDATYQVRVVSGTVTSSRTGGNNGELGVQVFRTEAPTGETVNIRNEIGGSEPDEEDPGSNTTSQTLAALSSGATTEVHSLATALIAGNDVAGLDFGYNFSTITNTRDQGQGSIRQFILNSNLLGNTNLDQEDAPAGVTAVQKDPEFEHTIFMIPTSDAGYGATPDGGSGNAFVITLSGTANRLPAIADSRTVIDGRTQTAFTGNTNLAVDEQSTGPEIIYDAAGFNDSEPVFDSDASFTWFYDVGITGATETDDQAYGIRLTANAEESRIFNSTLYSNASHALRLEGADDVLVQDNIIRNNGSGTDFADGVFGDGTDNIQVLDNQILSTSGYGISLGGTITDFTVSGNLVKNNGTSGTSDQSGIAVIDVTVTGGTISTNEITGNAQDGILITAGSGITITQNSIYSNGQLGIDLVQDEVTINDSGDGDGDPNGLFNFPILTSATLESGELTIEGFARPGTIIELFLANEDPTGFGEGETYITTVTEGSGDDQNSGTGSYSGTINGKNQGADNTNRFQFVISVGSSVLQGSILTATGTDASGNTSEFSGTVSVTFQGVDILGFVYEDENHNLGKDASENGTGLTLFAKLIDITAPSTVDQSVTVDPATGAYEFNQVLDGEYRIIIDDNTTASDVTPTIPSGWIGTQLPDQIRDSLTVSGVIIGGVNFGLFNGSKVLGTVFVDNGNGGGTPNDGVLNGGEIPQEAIAIRATDNAGTTIWDETTTNSDGTYTVWLPVGAGGTIVQIQQTNVTEFVSIGGQAGTTSGSYDRTTDVVSYTNVLGTTYTGVDFGDVPPNRLLTDGEQFAPQGTSVFFSHQFDANTGGEVTFSLSDAPSAGDNWTALIYRDTNCNGVLDTGEPIISAPETVTAGQTICLIVKTTVPLGVPDGSSNTITLSADFDFTNAAPALSIIYTRQDLVNVGNAGDTGLKITKSVDKTSALPGESLTYIITYVNNGTEPITTLEILDSTPAYTVFASASFATLPDNLTNCVITEPGSGNAGAIKWTFSGSLDPGASSTVSYVVTIQN
ncbi:MAG: SdrD B-like domain-containing protein [Bacteroidota bacterium]